MSINPFRQKAEQRPVAMPGGRTLERVQAGRRRPSGRRESRTAAESGPGCTAPCWATASCRNPSNAASTRARSAETSESPRWETTGGGDGRQIAIGDPVPPQWFGQIVARRDGVLDRHVDADAASGDMACAASPMHSSPSVCQRRSRSTRTSRCLMSSIDVSVATASAESGSSALTSRRNASMPRARNSGVGSLCPEVGDLVIALARDHAEGLARSRPGQKGEFRVPSRGNLNHHTSKFDRVLARLQTGLAASTDHRPSHATVNSARNSPARQVPGSALRSPCRRRAAARWPRSSSAT